MLDQKIVCCANEQFGFVKKNYSESLEFLLRIHTHPYYYK